MNAPIALRMLAVLMVSFALVGCGDDEPVSKDEQHSTGTPKKPFSAPLPPDEAASEGDSDSDVGREAVPASDNAPQQTLPPPG